MKRQLRFFWIITAVSTAVFTCISCGGGVQNYVPRSDARLLSLKIGELPRVTDADDSGSFRIPAPINGFNWDDEDFNLVGADIGSAPMEHSSDTVNVRLYPEISAGARVEWGIGSQDMRPFRFIDRRVNATFEDADYLYFKVTAEDGETINYYRFVIWVLSPVTEISEVYIGRYEWHETTSATGTPTIVVDIDERIMASMESPYPDLSSAKASTLAPGVLSVPIDQSQNVDIEVTRFDTNAALRYGMASSSSAEPEWSTSNNFNLTDQTYLYVEVTAENAVDKAYYKFRIEVGRIASIKTLTFVGKDGAKFDVANTGTRAGSWTSVALGKFDTADMPDDGFGVEIVLDDPKSRGSWELIANKNAPNPNATVNSPFNNPPKVVFDGTKVLALKVESENVVNGRTGATRYYKIEVELLAAAFVTHPKSAYYYNYNESLEVGNAEKGKVPWFTYVAKLFRDYTVSPTNPLFQTNADVIELTAELDRAVTGTYQWYEANSWYGGYGFDANGKILFYPPGDSKAVPEDGFETDAYHVEGFDEKANVSFHNGGNEYYRLVYPGKPISGASGTIPSDKILKYTPTIEDKRPFIDGFTNETHYYWVLIKDSANRTAVSKRAAIVTERDPRKKHHIVNLTDDVNGDLYLGPKDNPTEKGYARNQKVFTRKREEYKIPVTFPAGFDVNDYTAATVQALFFLKDGTPWIQNWTQGDIGFEDEDGTQLIYYNLTNNNGTLGLVGGGKEPNGGSLEKTPKYLIVKPAGEQPVNEMPLLNADGTPKPDPDKSAQGWFCGFIELVEVRFEGPARE